MMVPLDPMGPPLSNVNGGAQQLAHRDDEYRRRIMGMQKKKNKIIICNL